MRRSFVPVTVLAVALAAGSCTNPQLEQRQWEEIQNLQTAASEFRAVIGELESRLDSLRRVAMKQDTALRLIVDFTGAAVPSYRQ